MLNSIAETCAKNCRHIVSLCGVDCYVVDTSTKNFASGDWKTAAFCGSCGYIKCTPQATHSYGCNEAFRWGGSYTFYCPLGLVMVACSLKDETGALLGGITAGPILVGNMEDLFDVTPDIKKIPFIETVKEYSEEDVTHLEKLIEAVSVFSLSHSQQKSIAESSAGVALGEPVDPARVSVSAPGSIPARYEEELRQLMSDKNKDAAQKLIDKLVTHIFLRCDMQLSAIKPQVAELFSLLSRVSADAGFQMRELSVVDASGMNEINGIQSLENLNDQLAPLLRKFISYAFDFVQPQHSNIVFNAIKYIKDHFCDKITLDEVANHVYVSKSYLSSIFNEETGESLTTFINKIRVNYSKELLRQKHRPISEIAAACGFDDQSYFTKVFKKMTGVSPTAFRN